MFTLGWIFAVEGKVRETIIEGVTGPSFVDQAVRDLETSRPRALVGLKVTGWLC